MTVNRMNLLLLLGTLVVAGIIGGVLVQNAGSAEEDGLLKKFDSVSEMRSYLRENGAPSGQTRKEVVYAGVSNPMQEMAEFVDTDFSTAAGPDFSATNVQVEGVDEADIVKCDGRYLYLISGTTLTIVDAYPAKDSRIVAGMAIEGHPFELFVYRDRLAVFTTVDEEVYLTPESSVAPVPARRPMTHALVYSLADRSSPELIRDLSFSGTYSDSRMIATDIYLITIEPVRFFGEEPLIPEMRDGGAPQVIPDVYYADIPGQSFVYHTATSFDIDTAEVSNAATYLIGYGSTLYVSSDSIYIAYPRTERSDPRPLTGSLLDEEMTRADGPGGRTILHRFAIGRGSITYAATGEVPGHLLNQFSLDEDGSYLRVATTVAWWDGQGSYQYNGVYILDRNLAIRGSLENLAAGERIYAARFIGDRLYLVTFKQIDPLFVIDLSDPNRPGVLGELKIPGYSDYLHPYDADHIIGIGRETETNEWGGVSVGGLKIALFDVSDVKNPGLLDTVGIGEAGSDSEALRDHKAFLFDRKRSLLVIPVREVRKLPITGAPYEKYGLTTWQGAYVFGVTPESGFVLKGTVTHDTGDDSSWYRESAGAVRRSLVIEDVLYTISEQRIIMSYLGNPGRTINEVALPEEIIRRYPPQVTR
jgi:inhibitor of cysteine peptidase